MIELGNKTYTVEQKRLREWLSLNEILISLGKAVEHRDRVEIADSICFYVSTAFHLEKKSIDDLPWNQVASAFNSTYEANNVSLSHIAFTRSEVKEEKKEVWDYPGRLWWTWTHDFAKEFGWEIEYIANLRVLDAFSLLQEIFLSQHFIKEWERTLSEYSLKYNKATKKSEPNPLPKPDWMKVIPAKNMKEPETIKMKKEAVPVGNVIRYSDIES